MSLHPQSRALLDMVYRVGAPRFHELDVPQARHSFQKLVFAFRPDVQPVASVTEVPIPRPGRGQGVLLARLYRPLQAEPGEQLPLLIYFHGGGWCIGDIPSYDVLCRELANLAGCAVLSVDYRLAPEHPFPGAVEDAWIAARWAHANPDILQIDPARIALGGDSAGGTLTAVTCLQLRDRGGFTPALQLLIYPCTEIQSTRPSRITYADGYFLDRDSLVWFFERYLPNAEDWQDWRASPLLAARFDNLAPACLVTAGCDPLTDDCLAYADALRASGVAVQHRHYEGMLHGFITLGKFFPPAVEAVRSAAAALAAAFGSPAGN
ncbi:MAG: alpha/beta hydrolase [Zoogloea sp.]|nr:alpha/beta hydrolase [Zoogloea sp.]